MSKVCLLYASACMTQVTSLVLISSGEQVYSYATVNWHCFDLDCAELSFSNMGQKLTQPYYCVSNDVMVQ